MDAIRVVGYVVGVFIFVYMCVEVWRSPMSTGSTVGWTIFSFFGALLALIVWLVTDKRRDYGTS